MKTWFVELYYKQVAVAVKRASLNFYYILRVYPGVYLWVYTYRLIIFL
jgi:hypothetical protein